MARRRVDGDVHRIIASRYPPVSVFDTLADAADLDFLFEIEGLTNDRLRQELGQLHLVAEGDRRVGAGWGPVMAAFCHPNPDGSRFSAGEYGVYYAGLSEQTAILEAVHGRERFLRQSTNHPAGVLEMRGYVARVTEPLDRVPANRRKAVLDPDSYAASRRFAAELRERGAWGIYYPSVRDRPDGRCVAIFRPPALTTAKQARHYRFYWNGRKIDRVERVGETFNVLDS